MDMRPDFVGLNGFVWFMGVVEDRNDPLKLGRMRVRCIGWHTDSKQEIPTSSLPWALPINPVNSGFTGGKGPVEGTWVIGFYLDGSKGQKPVVMGSIPGIDSEEPNYERGFSDPNRIYPKYPGLGVGQSSIDKLGRNDFQFSPDNSYNIGNTVTSKDRFRSTQVGSWTGQIGGWGGIVTGAIRVAAGNLGTIGEFDNAVGQLARNISLGIDTVTTAIDSAVTSAVSVFQDALPPSLAESLTSDDSLISINTIRTAITEYAPVVRELAIVLVDDPNDLARIENVLGILDSTNLLITLTTLPPGQVGFAAKALSNELILTSLRTGNSGQIKHILSNITPSDAVRILTTDVEGFVNQNDVITVSPGTNTTAVNPNAALSSINTAGSVFGNTNVSSSAPIAGVPSTKERAGVAVLAGLSTQDRVNFLSSLTPEQRAEILNDYNDDEMLRIVYGMAERQITNTFTGMYNRASPATRRWLDAVETPVRSALFSFIGTGQVQYPTVRDTLDIIAAGSGNEKIRKAVAVVKILSRAKGLKESIEPFLNQGLNEVFGFGTQEFSTAVGGLTIASKIPVPVFPIGGQIRSNPWDEPSSPYKAEYPKNDVKRTESGHIFELDDTPGAERVHIYHRAGSFVEFHPDGSVVYRTIGNNYQITAQNQFVNIQGSCNITIDGSAEMYIAGDLIKKIGGNVVEIVGGNYRKEITGDYTELVMGSKQTQTIVSESSLVGGTRNTTTLLSRTDIVLAYEEKFVGMAYNEQILGVDTRIVGGIKTTSVAGACVLGVGGAYTETVGGAILMNAGGIINSIAGGAITMEAGGAIVGLAGGTITFSAGAAAVFASAAITQILGVLVRLN